MSQTTTPGWVYVLRSTSHKEIVKIGSTTRHPSQRIVEVDPSIGYRAFGPWTKVWSRQVSDARHVETTTHRMLSDRRVRLNKYRYRELFGVDHREACQVVEAASGTVRHRVVRPATRPRRQQRPARLQGWIRRSLSTAMALAMCLAVTWMLEPDLLPAILHELATLP